MSKKKYHFSDDSPYRRLVHFKKILVTFLKYEFRFFTQLTKNIYYLSCCIHFRNKAISLSKYKMIILGFLLPAFISETSKNLRLKDFELINIKVGPYCPHFN